MAQNQQKSLERPTDALIIPGSYSPKNMLNSQDELPDYDDHLQYNSVYDQPLPGVRIVTTHGMGEGSVGIFDEDGHLMRSIPQNGPEHLELSEKYGEGLKMDPDALQHGNFFTQGLFNVINDLTGHGDPIGDNYIRIDPLDNMSAIKFDHFEPYPHS